MWIVELEEVLKVARLRHFSLCHRTFPSCTRLRSKWSKCKTFIQSFLWGKKKDFNAVLIDLFCQLKIMFIQIFLVLDFQGNLSFWDNVQNWLSMILLSIWGWQKEYRSANVGRRHENINTKMRALHFLYAWIINSFVHARAYTNSNLHTIYAFTLLHNEDNYKWHRRWLLLEGFRAVETFFLDILDIFGHFWRVQGWDIFVFSLQASYKEMI